MFVQTHFQCTRHLAARKAPIFTKTSSLVSVAAASSNQAKQQHHKRSISSRSCPHHNNRTIASTSTSSSTCDRHERNASRLATASRRVHRRPLNRERSIKCSPIDANKVATVSNATRLLKQARRCSESDLSLASGDSGDAQNNTRHHTTIVQAKPVSAGNDCASSCSCTEPNELSNEKAKTSVFAANHNESRGSVNSDKQQAYRASLCGEHCWQDCERSTIVATSSRPCNESAQLVAWRTFPQVGQSSCLDRIERGNSTTINDSSTQVGASLSDLSKLNDRLPQKNTVHTGRLDAFVCNLSELASRSLSWQSYDWPIKVSKRQRWHEQLMYSAWNNSKFILCFVINFITYQLESLYTLARDLLPLLPALGMSTPGVDYGLSTSAQASKTGGRRNQNQMFTSNEQPIYASYSWPTFSSTENNTQQEAQTSYGVVHQQHPSQQLNFVAPLVQQSSLPTHYIRRHNHGPRLQEATDLIELNRGHAVPISKLSHPLRHTIEYEPVHVESHLCNGKGRITCCCCRHQSRAPKVTAPADPNHTQNDYAELRIQSWQQQQRVFSLANAAQAGEQSPACRTRASPEKSLAHLRHQTKFSTPPITIDKKPEYARFDATVRRDGRESASATVRPRSGNQQHKLRTQSERTVLESSSHDTSYIHCNSNKQRHEPKAANSYDSTSPHRDLTTKRQSRHDAGSIGTGERNIAHQTNAKNDGEASSTRSSHLLATPLSKVSLAGARRRLGFKQHGGLSSLSIHRSEEVYPDERWRLAESAGSDTGGWQRWCTTASNSVYSSSVDESSSSKQQRMARTVGKDFSARADSNLVLNTNDGYAKNSNVCFVDGLGAGQIASRQALVSPYLGDVQLTIGDQRGMLEVEVIQVRRLQCKPFAKRLPSPYVKVYLMRDKKCIAKFKTDQVRRCLDPVYQQKFLFRDDYSRCVLQVIVWGDYGKKDRKSLMGVVQVHLDDLNLTGDLIVGWYKLLNALSVTSTLSSCSSKVLRQTMSSTRIGSDQLP